MKTKKLNKFLSLLLALVLVVGMLPVTAMAEDSSQVTSTDYVLINGVKWATRNVAAPGTFASSPEDTGLFYQWNSKVGWPETGAIGSITATDGTTIWNSTWSSSGTPSASDTWATANDPSPTGYRMPTDTEIQTLLDETKVTKTWSTQNSVNGYKFTDIATGNSIFLPASGFRYNNDGVLWYAGERGEYWSSTARYATGANDLEFNNNNAALAFYDRGNGFTVRPVVASSNFVATTDNSTANNTETLGLIGTSAASSSDGIVTAAISNGYIAITSVSAGTATITITDNASHSATIAVTVNTDGSVTLGTITKYSVRTDITWYTGHGTETSFTIDTGAELAGLASLVNDGTDTFENDTITLGDSISLASYAWTPIGTTDHPFNGTFNGDDYSITGLAIGTSGSYNATFVHAGLFGCTGVASEIQNVNLVGAAIYAGATSSSATPAMVGGLVGNNGGTITGCAVTGTVATTGEAAYVGGIAGGSSGPLSGCTSAATVTGADYVGTAGGIVGYTTASITDCSSSGAVSVGTKKWDYPMAGGIVGYLYNRTDGTVKVSGCHATGAVSGGDYTQLGGIAGNCEREIINSYATGNVSGGTVSMIGGLVGVGACPITNNYATGFVTGGRGSGAGGLAGSSSTFAISHCWASGDVFVDGSGSIGENDGNSAGGLVGTSHSYEISYCYAIGDASGTSFVGGLIGENKKNTSPYLALTDCYAAGSATGTIKGGLSSNGAGAVMTNCYWNSTNNAEAYGGGVTTGTPVGKTTAEMKTAAFAQLLTDDSGGNCSWIYVSGANNGYPLISGVGNAVLSGLAVSSGSLTPAFSSGITDYSVSVDGSVTGMTVTPATSDTNASITVNGSAVISGNASSEVTLTAGTTTDISVVVTDGIPITYTLHVTRAVTSSAPAITSANHTTVISGVGGTFQVTATGTSPITYSLSNNAPSTVSIDSSTGLMTIGAIDINASQSNTYTFTVSAANGINPVATQSFTLTVLAPPVIRLPGFVQGTVGVPYEVQLPVTGAAPISWSIVSGSLPAGLSLSANGLLSGTPTTAGTSTFSIRATNSDGMDTEQYSLTIQAAAGANDAPSGSGGGTTTTTPVTTVSGTTATTTVTPTVSNGLATSSVTNDQMSDALKKAQAAAGTSGTPNVEIQVSSASGASGVSTTVPHASMQALVSGGVGALTISGPTGSVSFDTSALKTISDASGDVTVTISRTESSTLSAAGQALVGSRPVFTLGVTSGGSAISQFGGNVTVSVPYTPAPDEDTNAIIIYYIAADGTPTLVPDARYDAATGRVVFTTTHFSTYAVGYNKVSFTDVASGVWYHDAVTFLAARGITSGATATTFGPDATLTRGQFITMLLRAYGVAAVTIPTDNFSDAGSTYYTGYLATAKKLGITTGVGNNKFAPDQAITRQEMFTLLYNAMKVLDKLPSGTSGKALADFTDASGIASWATDAMRALVKAGTVTGDSGKLNPAGTTTRAEMAQVLYNLLGK